MQPQQLNSTVNRTIVARVLSIAIFSTAFALMMTGCSTSVKLGDAKPSETNKVDVSSPPSNSAATDSSSGDVAATYSVNGSSADGKAYKGDLLITKRGSVNQLSWKLDAGSYDGVGVQNGNALAAAYTTGTDGKGCGAIVYKISPDGSLDGTWGEWGVNSSGTEKAVQIGETNGGVGSFNVSGTNANGSAYKGKLTISMSGNDVYQFAWDTNTKFVGTGVKLGNYLAAGSGAKQCGFVIYEVNGDTLEGKWGVPGATTLGSEKATKK